MSDNLPPVLLLHGFGGSAARTWHENGWVALLEDTGRTVVAPDLPGHGPGDHSTDPADYQDLEGWAVEQLLEAGGGEPVDAVGFSAGARLLLLASAAEPRLVRRLVVSGVGESLFRGDDPEPMAAAIESEEPPTSPWAAHMHQLARGGGNTPGALAAFLRRPRGDRQPTTPASLATVTCPVLVVLGDGDFAGPADPLVDALADPTLVVLARTDHFATPRSMRFLDAALEFLG